MGDGVDHGFRRAFEQVGEADQNLTFPQPYGGVQRGEAAKANRNGRHRRPRAKRPVLFLKDGAKLGVTNWRIAKSRE